MFRSSDAFWRTPEHRQHNCPKVATLFFKLATGHAWKRHAAMLGRDDILAGRSSRIDVSARPWRNRIGAPAAPASELRTKARFRSARRVLVADASHARPGTPGVSLDGMIGSRSPASTLISTMVDPVGLLPGTN